MWSMLTITLVTYVVTMTQLNDVNCITEAGQHILDRINQARLDKNYTLNRYFNFDPVKSAQNITTLINEFIAATDHFETNKCLSVEEKDMGVSNCYDVVVDKMTIDLVYIEKHKTYTAYLHVDDQLIHWVLKRGKHIMARITEARNANRAYTLNRYFNFDPVKGAPNITILINEFIAATDHFETNKCLSVDEKDMGYNNCYDCGSSVHPEKSADSRHKRRPIVRLFHTTLSVNTHHIIRRFSIQVINEHIFRGLLDGHHTVLTVLYLKATLVIVLEKVIQPGPIHVHVLRVENPETPSHGTGNRPLLAVTKVRVRPLG
ncbi:unnamed protein product [Oppiella nova]|uniref:Uncharacterized protein n=1 Tax=Oppiella nova TaxID=334625 RepID=A0A7R9LPV9_9ACAR|nr:unnamed protein product [Oppiella nova]CAG2165799.1 unnamed protein product [Oppiella nova]